MQGQDNEQDKPNVTQQIQCNDRTATTDTTDRAAHLSLLSQKKGNGKSSDNILIQSPD